MAKIPSVAILLECRDYANRQVLSGIPLRTLPASRRELTAGLRVALATAPSPSPQKTPPAPPCWRHEWLDPGECASLQLAQLPDADGYLLRVPGLCDFLLDPHEGTVEVMPLADLDPHTLEHLLIDQALPRLLAGRGHLMLHASQIRVGDGSVLFLGRSGWGKSTLAGLLHQQGLPALCDDCVLMEFRDGRGFATPSYPGLRLYEDSIEQLDTVANGLTPVSDYSSKQRVIGLDIPQPMHAPSPVDAIYVLAEPDATVQACMIQPLSPANACMAVVEHSFRLDPTEKAQTRQLLRQAVEITRATPTFALQYPRDFQRQHELLGVLQEHFASLRNIAP